MVGALAIADLFITLDKVWPDGDPPGERRRAASSSASRSAPFSTVTIEDTGQQERVWTSFGSADWSEQIDLDVTVDRDALADHALVAIVRRPRRPHRPARRRRLRHQEARHDLLHGRAGDLRVPGLGHRRGRFVRAGRAAGGPRPLCDPRTADPPRILDVRLRAAGPSPARLRNGRGGSPGGAPGPLARPPVHRASTATTGSRFVRTSTGSSSRAR